MRHLIRLFAVIASMATALLGAPAVLANADEGEGGRAAGAAVDPLASQSSLVFDWTFPAVENSLTPSRKARTIAPVSSVSVHI